MLQNDGEVVTGSEAIASCLEQAGVASSFAYPGTSELALCDAILRRGIGLVNSRGDKEAVFMAAGSNVWAAGTSVAVVHGARGLTNAMGAVADVRRSEVGVLILVGLPSSSSAPFLPPHGESGLLSAAAAFASAKFDLTETLGGPAEDLVTLVNQALETVRRRPGGPVLLGVPQDVAAATYNRKTKAAVVDGARTAAITMPSPEVAGVVEQVRGKQAVILADDYLFRWGREAEAALQRLAGRLGAPIYQVRYRRGPMFFEKIDRVSAPNFAGYYDPTDHQSREVLTSAEVLITVEDRNMYPRVVGSFGTGLKVAVNSLEAPPRKNGYLREDDHCLVGDVPKILELLADGVGSDDRPLRSPVTERPLVSPPNESAAMLARTVNSHARQVGARIVDDSQMFGGLLAAHYGDLDAGVRVFGSHGGFVGGGLATAIGVALNPAVTQPVLCTLGDQAFTNSLQALAALDGNGGRLTVLVCNNGSSVSLRTQFASEMAGDARRLSDWLGNVEQMDYRAIGMAYGLEAHRVEWPADAGLPEAARSLTALLSQPVGSRARLIELVVPGTPEFWSGIWATTGLEETA